MSPSAHGDVVAGILKPYISQKSFFILSMHEIFQGFHYFHFVGGDKYKRDEWQTHPHYNATCRFCDLYDQTSFDETYASLPLQFFEPMVVRLFSKVAYWDYENHPKAVAVTGQ